MRTAKGKVRGGGLAVAPTSALLGAGSGRDVEGRARQPVVAVERRHSLAAVATRARRAGREHRIGIDRRSSGECDGSRRSARTTTTGTAIAAIPALATAACAGASGITRNEAADSSRLTVAAVAAAACGAGSKR
jgi:hypothetical protein